MSEEQPKKKRGRRKKSEMQALVEEQQKIPKKRGRKPKGGKISSKQSDDTNEIITPENIILHLKCNISDIKNNNSQLIYDPEIPPEIQTYNILENENYTDYEKHENKEVYQAYTEEKHMNEYICSKCNDSKCADINVKDVDIKELHSKIKKQKQILYNNDVQGKMSACFWCTYEFDNPPCCIPKAEHEDRLQGYGSFCRPECAVAYLFEENIDDSVKFERYQLLNKLYSKVYNYKNNIKPAPDPHYLLDKFYGNLNIQEYRKLLSSDNLLFVIDKPMTRVLPELFEDTDNFIVGIYDNNSSNKSKSSSSVYKVKRQSEKIPGPSKTSIIRDKFGVNAG
jgi:hypothetical protein